MFLDHDNNIHYIFASEICTDNNEIIIYESSNSESVWFCALDTNNYYHEYYQYKLLMDSAIVSGYLDMTATGWLFDYRDQDGDEEAAEGNSDNEKTSSDELSEMKAFGGYRKLADLS